MDDVLYFNEIILNAVQSLKPLEKLNAVKVNIERIMEASDKGYYRDEIAKKLITINGLLKYFTSKVDGDNKNFNKFLVFANIRDLLKNSSIKLGQIEKEAGVQSGYMSRLEKLENTTDPSIEFLLTASKLLNISVDSMISYDFRSLTETELYLLKVIDKFRTDTLNNKLDWQTYTATFLNEAIQNEYFINNPLFEEHELNFDEGGDYPEVHTLVTFDSMAYGPATKIADDCYYLELKNHSVIYIMSIKRLLTRKWDKEGYSKEIWLINRNSAKECLISEKNISVLSKSVDLLYDDIKTYKTRPQLSKGTRDILDGFLADDLTSDDKQQNIY